MAHHAYFVVSDIEEGVLKTHQFIGDQLNMPILANPDIFTLRYGLLSVEDARKLRSLAELAPTKGDQKVLIISASRIFHEAQNALLKLFEEPPQGTVLILIIPAEGMLLPTLRSRLLPLPSQGKDTFSNIQETSTAVKEFLSLSSAEREKFFTKIVDRSKSDKDEEKQSARLSAIELLSGLEIQAYGLWSKKDSEKESTTSQRKNSLQAFLSDLNTFIPILHERSAPLKLIFEHLLMSMPTELSK
jgi:hypothetical protein